MGNPFSTPPTKGFRLSDLNRSSPTEVGSSKAARGIDQPCTTSTPVSLSAFAYNARNSNKPSRYSRAVPSGTASTSEAEEESSQAKLLDDDITQSPPRKAPTTNDMRINPHGPARGEAQYGMFSPSRPSHSRPKMAKADKNKPSSFLEGIKAEAAYRSDHGNYTAAGLPTTPPLGPILDHQMSRQSDSSRTVIEVEDGPDEVIDLTQPGSSKRKGRHGSISPSSRKLKKKNKTKPSFGNLNNGERVRHRYGPPDDVGANTGPFEEATDSKDMSTGDMLAQIISPHEDSTTRETTHVQNEPSKNDTRASQEKAIASSTGNTTLADRIKEVIAEEEADITKNLATALGVVVQELRETPGVTLADIKREFDVLFADASKQREAVMENLRGVFLPGL